MTDVQRVHSHLEAHRATYLQDPNDDSFWVERSIVEQLRKLPRFKRDPFEPLKASFGMHVMMLEPGGQFEVFPHHVGIRRLVFTKGDDVCLCSTAEVVPWHISA